MHVHPPKPLHGWREFFGEVGIIVLGILIALALEQAVESLHGRERAHQVQEQLHVEISDNVQSAAMWLAAAPCLDRQISDIENGLLAARESGRYAGAERFSPPLVRFQSEAWLNARAMQVFDRLPARDAKALGSFYFFPTEMQGNVVALHSQAGELEVLSRPLGHVTTGEADELLAKLGRAKELYSRMNLASLLLVTSGKNLGAAPPKAWPRDEVAASLGFKGKACVVEPMRVWRIANAAHEVNDVRSALHLRYSIE
jgi:type II secretory pathway pseudopilin PulG